MSRLAHCSILDRIWYTALLNVFVLAAVETDIWELRSLEVWQMENDWQRPFRHRHALVSFSRTLLNHALMISLISTPAQSHCNLRERRRVGLLGIPLCTYYAWSRSDFLRPPVATCSLSWDAWGTSWRWRLIPNLTSILLKRGNEKRRDTSHRFVAILYSTHVAVS